MPRSQVCARREFLAKMAAETAVKKRKGRTTLVPVVDLAKRAERAGFAPRSKSVLHADVGPRRCVRRQAKDAARQRNRYKLSRVLAENSHTYYVSA